MDWYYADAGESVGPVSDEQLQELVTSGKITGESLVWHEGMAEWQTYASVQGAPAASGEAEAPEAPAGRKLSLKRDSGPSASPSASRDQTCAECGKTFPTADMVQYESSWVCATCKPVFFQRLREGADTPWDLDYAGFWIRAGAKILDWIILSILSFVVQLVVFGIVLGAAAASNGSANEAAAIVANLVSSLVQMVIGIGYVTFFVGKFAATPGKMACGLKIVTAEGERVTYLRAFARYWAEIISGLICGIGYIIAAFDDEKRTLHDHICSTRVVRK
jgi:uncharacterized RDD family membrane protein YckC